MLFGLVGKSLSHSFSKKIFEDTFSSLGLTGYTYELWEFKNSSDIKPALSKKENLKGFNITIPYKETIIPYLDDVSEEVINIGACNCIVVKNNLWIGYNTDCFGFSESLKPLLKSHHTKAIILGTGGSSRAVQYALKLLHIPYTLVTSSLQKKNNNTILYDELTEKIILEHSIVINTTPLGMHPNINAMPDFPTKYLNEQHLVFDLIYNPEKTLLLKEAEKRNAAIQNGLEMLYLQAKKSWYLWNKE